MLRVTNLMREEKKIEFTQLFCLREFYGNLQLLFFDRLKNKFGKRIFSECIHQSYPETVELIKYGRWRGWWWRIWLRRFNVDSEKCWKSISSVEKSWLILLPILQLEGLDSRFAYLATWRRWMRYLVDATAAESCLLLLLLDSLISVVGVRSVQVFHWYVTNFDSAISFCQFGDLSIWIESNDDWDLDGFIIILVVLKHVTTNSIISRCSSYVVENIHTSSP